MGLGQWLAQFLLDHPQTLKYGDLWACVINSSFKYLCHHDWDILRVFGDLHHFGVPFFCSLVVFPCVSCFTFIIDRNGSAKMIIPIHYCELPFGFVDLEPRE